MHAGPNAEVNGPNCEENPLDGSSGNDPDGDDLFDAMEFSIEEELLFSRRWEEGYDLNDPRYDAWLNARHPSCVSPAHQSSSTAPCQPTSISSPLPDQPSSISPADQLSSTVPRQPSYTSPHQPSSISPGSPHQPFSTSPAPPHQPSSISPGSPHQPFSTSPAPPNQPSSISPCSPHQPSSTSPAPPRQPSSISSVQRSPLSDLLNLPVPIPKQKTGHARVLTSAECWSILKEKEEKKRKEAEDKEKRKRERELKKKEREELNKRKVEERARKAEERARKAEEREKRRTEIEKERARKAALKQNKLKGGSCKRPGPSTQQEATTSAQGDASGRTLRKRAKVSVDSTIFTDLCCVCFGSFEEDQGTGREWLQCLCTRWIHKDCIFPNATNATNKLCPIC